MSLQEFLSAPVSCRPEISLAEAASQMDSHGVGSLIVVDDANKVVGIVTDRDIVIRGIARELAPSSPVREVMTSDVASLSEDADLFDAAQRMASAECRRMPVVDTEGMLKGVVSLDDLMVIFSRQTGSLAQVIAAEQVAH
ncbi:CBS domain-containing protein [Saccharopolyspora shandongensis]|uniref:CBS domain-containing protein n=1 Tax=Saccharopolyspora shandongensis TaxID=418495 RepID=A0A1H3TE64_9PSEU|nr:CBS domain-containing protein [Saccharopolyspora shandongensis]SDZ48526.1 CBS domain-containing protein [Saccharopolyspora shandongensis]